MTKEKSKNEYNLVERYGSRHDKPENIEKFMLFRQLSAKEQYDRTKKEYSEYFHQGTRQYTWIVGDFNCGCKFCKEKYDKRPNRN